MAKVYARLIHKGKMTLEEVPEKYHDAVIDAYYEIYGEHIG